MRPPVFILGLHRSGTTLLYQLLAASDLFNVVTARHVIYFDRLRDRSANGVDLSRKLSEKFHHLGLADRGVDAVGLSPATPEEYSFILDKLHAGLKITRRNFHVFRHLCEVVQRDYGNERPLLLKSPWDFGRGALIQSLIPDARIIYIHREPFARLSSLFRVVAAAASQRHTYLSLISPRYRSLTESGFPWRTAQWLITHQPDRVARLIINSSGRETRAYLRNVRATGGADRFDVQFETLCQRPNETMQLILQYLDAPQASANYAAMIGTPQTSILPPIVRNRELVLRQLGDYAVAVGYNPLAVPATIAF